MPRRLYNTLTAPTAAILKIAPAALPAPQDQIGIVNAHWPTALLLPLLDTILSY